MAYVAAGRFDGYYQDGLNLWDIAAGIILIKEAGGVINEIDLSRAKNLDVIASSPDIHSKMMKKYITFNCFKKIFCYKSQNEKKHTPRLPHYKSRDDRWFSI